MKSLGERCSGQVVDLSSFASIRAFADRVKATLPRLDILVDNAGVFLPQHSKTAEGFEVTLGTNAIGTALLTNLLLLPLVAASPTGRVVVLSSDAIRFVGSAKPWPRLADVGGTKASGENEGSGLVEYADSKLLNAFWAQGLQRKLEESPKTAHILVASCHPGSVKTDIHRKIDSSASCLGSFIKNVIPLGGLFTIPVTTGALSTLFCATATAVVGGEYYTPGPKGYIRCRWRASVFIAQRRSRRALMR